MAYKIKKSVGDSLSVQLELFFFYSRKRGALNSSLAAIVVVGPRPVVHRHDLQLNYSSKVCIGVIFLWFLRVLRLEWQ